MLRLYKSFPSFDVVHVVLAAATCRTHTRLDKLRCCMTKAAYMLGVFRVDLLINRRCYSLPAGSAVLLKLFAMVACPYQNQRNHAKATVKDFIPFDALHIYALQGICSIRLSVHATRQNQF